MLDQKHSKEKARIEEFVLKQTMAEFSRVNMRKAYNNLFEILWYSRVPCFGLGNLSLDYGKYGPEMAFLKKCKWKSIIVPCNKIFRTISTDKGFCCAFNAEGAETLYKESQYRRNFLRMEAIDKDLGNMAHGNQASDWDNPEKVKEMMVPAIGKSMGLQIFLDSQADWLASGSFSEDETGFRVHLLEKAQISH